MEILTYLSIFCFGALFGAFVAASYRFWKLVFGGAHSGDLRNIYRAARAEMERRGML